jgi:hypothetical protein
LHVRPIKGWEGEPDEKHASERETTLRRGLAGDVILSLDSRLERGKDHLPDCNLAKATTPCRLRGDNPPEASADDVVKQDDIARLAVVIHGIAPVSGHDEAVRSLVLHAAVAIC